ncbi:hypothetical protein DLP05_085 [Stenotrophomonas phage vB_SmaS_DLP_5]|uniref:Uncharacterized protein n=1 Tax=Stenotrophomonas phage vB_SmaS_DLP_5 TaxID=2044561 RepID=A0A2D2W346_9CAUD|nr:hypothetical protein FDJ07_gp136 [Stenotrophomonas phage vB_SmaS_DLP_5]ATS92396.1 hypothetical protein DLP05_085 [Stenotrophomonas phage vB_SmaS_DLP_5]
MDKTRWKWKWWFKYRKAIMPNDRHWWVTTKNGHRVHQWFSIHTLENQKKDMLILQVVVGPWMINLAGAYKVKA